MSNEKKKKKRTQWNSYQVAYKAKSEIHNRIRKCDKCGEEVPEYRLQNHKLTNHLETSRCEFCDVEVKHLAKHCKSKKHRENLLLKKPIYINESKQREVL